MTKLERKFLIFDCPKKPKFHGTMMIVAAATITGMSCIYKRGSDEMSWISMAMYYIGLLLFRKDIFLKEMKQMRSDNERMSLNLTDEQWEFMSETVNNKMFMTADGMWVQMKMVLVSMVMFMTAFTLSTFIILLLSGK